MEPLVEFEQAGNLRAEYGKALINNLAADLGLPAGVLAAAIWCTCACSTRDTQ